VGWESCVTGAGWPPVAGTGGLWLNGFAFDSSGRWTRPGRRQL